jgi:hypothetical protein
LLIDFNAGKLALTNIRICHAQSQQGDYQLERKDIWVQKLQDWEMSGLKRAEYCRQNQIPVSTFDYWRKRIRKESALSSDEKGLVKLPMFLKQSTQVSYSIDYPSGHKIQIPENYSSEPLKRLIRKR